MGFVAFVQPKCSIFRKNVGFGLENWSQLHVTISALPRFGRHRFNASALQSTLFRDITSVTNSGLILDAVASFREALYILESSIF